MPGGYRPDADRADGDGAAEGNDRNFTACKIRSYMNEKKIQGRLKKTAMIVAATGVILLAAAGFFGFFRMGG